MTIVTVPPAESQSQAGPVQVAAAYTAEFWRNVEGGRERDGVYLDNLDVTVDIDADALWGLDDTRIFLYGLYNNGRSLSARAGDLQVNSNIETGVEALRLYEAWVERALGARGTIRFGLYDLNSEFDVLPASALFIHGAHGIGSDFGLTGRNGPSIFPVTSLALRVDWALDEHWKLRAAVLDGVPGDPADPGATAIQLGDGDGALLVGELQWTDERRRVLLGGWAYTADYEEWPDALPAVTETSDGNAGAYIRGEAGIGGPQSGMTVFGRLGVAAGRYNVLSRYLGAGLEWRGPLPSRPDDALGLAMAWGEASGDYRDAVALGGGRAEDREVALELTYRMPLGEYLVLQPDIQYVISPGLDPALDNALMLGVRLQIAL